MATLDATKDSAAENGTVRQERRPSAGLWGIAAVLVLSMVWFALDHVGSTPAEGEILVRPLAWLTFENFGIVARPGAVFFRLILPAEILAFMVLAQGLRLAFPGYASSAGGILRFGIPVGMLVLLIVNWQFYTWFADVPHYVLPSPVRVAQSLLNDWPILLRALLVTLRITFSALALALIGGVLLAIVMSQSRLIELALFPYAVILQVTPIIAVAPLIIIYAPSTQTALLIIAWIVAFFPVLSNTAQGLSSTDHNLLNLFELYGASRWQTLLLLKIPNALPYFLAGLRIAGGLALIASVVAEFTAGSAGAGSGLAFRLLESQFRLNIPRLYAALILLSFSGVLIYFATSFISHLLLRKWHESAVRREN